MNILPALDKFNTKHHSMANTTKKESTFILPSSLFHHTTAWKMKHMVVASYSEICMCSNNIEAVGRSAEFLVKQSLRKSLPPY